MSSYDCLDLCRLCLVKDRVSVPIFEGEGDVRQIFLKITACLPVKVAREDKLPKKICDDCVYKVELLYEFWNTTANAEKQLLQWLGDVGMEDKRGYVSSVMNSQELMKQETVENRLDGTVMQTEEHQNNMGINMMDQMGLTMPIIMSTDQQQMTSVSMASSGNNIQAVPGTSTQSSQRGRKSGNNDDDDEEESEEEDNTDDECDNEEGLSVKEESTVSNTTGRSHEPAFVNVSIPCDEAGPSGLQQQQKISDLPEMVMTQTADGDPKSGYNRFEECLTDSDTETQAPTDDSHLDSDLSDIETYRSILKIEKDAPHRCDSCEEGFPTEVDLLTHRTISDYCSELQNPRKRKLNYETNYLNPNKKQRFHETAEEFSCNVCHKIFREKKYLRVHMSKHNLNHICHICGAKMTSDYYLSLHIDKHKKDYPIFCGICKKGFHLKTALNYHMAMHTKFKPFECELCQIKFTNKIYYNSHVMKTHNLQNNLRKYSCSVCNFITYYDYCYKEHLWTHAGNGQLPCELCGKLLHKNYIKTHMRIHTGEKPEICEFCGRTFAFRRYLIKHRKLHTGERRYECDICFKRFTQKAILIGHLRTHQRDVQLI